MSNRDLFAWIISRKGVYAANWRLAYQIVVLQISVVNMYAERSSQTGMHLYKSIFTAYFLIEELFSLTFKRYETFFKAEFFCNFFTADVCIFFNRRWSPYVWCLCIVR